MWREGEYGYPRFTLVSAVSLYHNRGYQKTGWLHLEHVRPGLGVMVCKTRHTSRVLDLSDTTAMNTNQSNSSKILFLMQTTIYSYRGVALLAYRA